MGSLHDLLFRAIASNDLPKARQLIERRVDLEAKNAQGQRPLAFAAHLGRLDMLSVLLKGGAKIDATDLQGWTAAMNASTRARADCLQALDDAGADMEIRNSKGQNAADIALVQMRPGNLHAAAAALEYYAQCVECASTSFSRREAVLIDQAARAAATTPSKLRP
jgi:ankyrin repeat protein